jgi:hypothetical protein
MLMRRRAAALAASTAALAAVTLVSAGPASADATPYGLCNPTVSIFGQLCAYAQGYQVNDQVSLSYDNPMESGTEWYYPSSGYGQISDDTNPKLCMEWDAADHNAVLTEPCDGKASEEWEAYVISSSSGLVLGFQNEYHPNGYMCLNADTGSGQVDAISCGSGIEPDEQWEVDL